MVTKVNGIYFVLLLLTALCNSVTLCSKIRKSKATMKWGDQWRLQKSLDSNVIVYVHLDVCQYFCFYKNECWKMSEFPDFNVNYRNMIDGYVCFEQVNPPSKQKSVPILPGKEYSKPSIMFSKSDLCNSLCQAISNSLCAYQSWNRYFCYTQKMQPWTVNRSTMEEVANYGKNNLPNNALNIFNNN